MYSKKPPLVSIIMITLLTTLESARAEITLSSNRRGHTGLIQIPINSPYVHTSVYILKIKLDHLDVEENFFEKQIQSHFKIPNLYHVNLSPLQEFLTAMSPKLNDHKLNKRFLDHALLPFVGWAYQKLIGVATTGNLDDLKVQSATLTNHIALDH